eukprot:m.12318 g.12318  ORF g.12318 m.12318 type:complete len:2363 (-) comp5819_c0_seq1:202-7290(-)
MGLYKKVKRPYGHKRGETGRGRGRGGGRGRGRGGRASDFSSRAPGQDRRSGLDQEEEDPELQRLMSKLDRLVTGAASDDRMDKRFGFDKHTAGARLGWLLNMQPTVFKDTEGRVQSGVDFYFLEEDGGRFKATFPFSPYFFIRVKNGSEMEVEQHLRRQFDAKILSIVRVEKEDLDLPNHLVGLKQLYLQLNFLNVHDLMLVKSKLSPAIKKNKQKMKSNTAYHQVTMAATTDAGEDDIAASSRSTEDVLDNLIDMREYDVPYHMRACIDCSIAVGKWFEVRVATSGVSITPREDLLLSPDCIVLAWDIETTKLPLKFPNADIDQVMMISYMIDGQGYLIINREIVSADIEDFEYTPKPEFEGPFIVFNETNEYNTLRRFFDHIQDVKPNIMVTYNGDFFDWPFIEQRCFLLGLNMYHEIGFRPDAQGEYKSRFAPHMDAFRWVKRDSYLPVGSQGLKEVTKKKLRYNPLEIHYEEICRMAAEQPQELANYSVSDAVATYYLYMKYVHPFIFALCTIIPLGPDDVLRKGSGTLCESLLMKNAFHSNIIMPNKHQADHARMHDGHLLESDTYSGGHVEALESGIFRNDIPCRFRIVPEAIQQLIDDIDNALEYAITGEHGGDMSTILNYEEEKAKIVKQLEDLRDNPYRQEVPLIYHLDVAAMYPNIILTNRLQPSAIVDDKTCAACDFNTPGATCQRKMEWKWRGELSPASRSEYEMIKAQLETELVPAEDPSEPPVPFYQLPPDIQAQRIKQRLHAYTRRVYKRTHDTKTESRVSTVCERENSFYVDTVRNFRDRRYRFKDKLKETKKELEQVEGSGDLAEIKKVGNLVVLYDSLQLAHKCILNSFYGYVMRKGARWYSMQMAGIVCLTGANIIKKAREIVDQIGRPLELDTDGIWCCLPGSFPENLVFKTTLPGKKSKIVVSYPGAMLNIMVKDHFTNDQYQELVNPETLEYETKSVNSIMFEVDGPYKAMILPASKEKDKRLKKRYAVFNMDGSLAELKGFEVKRNGELKLIKLFQGSVFEAFLQGDTLEEVYESVAAVGNHWLDVLYSRGLGMADTELFDLISENRSMSKTLKEYEGQKSTSISTAKRLAEFLGQDMVKDKGLACQFVVSRKPEGAPVTERAIPVAIFQAEEAVKTHFLRKWTKQGANLESTDIREILDWDYYIERLGSTIMKIITIPAAMQHVANPIPRVKHPDWLQARLVERSATHKQQRITDFATAVSKPIAHAQDIPSSPTSDSMDDIEDQCLPCGAESPPHQQPTVTIHRRIKGKGGKKGRVVQEEVQAGDWRQVLGTPPDINDGYSNWLDFHKRKWKIQAAERRRLKMMGISGSTAMARGASQAASTMRGFINQKRSELASGHWEIIQIAETRVPGQMKVWAMVGGDLHCMKLDVHRKFYVNFRTPDESGKRERVTRQLPRMQPCHYLYEFKMPESNFQQHQRVLTAKLAHPDVLGVYEMNIPLLWQSVVYLGCMAAVNPKFAMNKKTGDNFELEEIQSKPIGSGGYLKAPMHTIFLYQSSTGSRATFALFFTATRSAYILIVDPGRNQTAIPNAKKLWKECYQQRIEHLQATAEMDEETLGQITPPENIRIDVQVVPTKRLASREINQHLMEYSEERHGPTVIITQSPDDLDTMQSAITVLEDFPVVQAPSSAKDNQYAALNWQTPAIRRALLHYATIDEWLYTQLETARYSHVPVGNLPADHRAFICDVFFARQLRKHGHLLWASPSNRPDFGGKEDDDFRLMTDDVGDTIPFEMNEPGVYDTVSVDMIVSSLPATAVLHAASINDIDGGASFGGGFEATQHTALDEMLGTGTMLSAFDETALCMPVFRIMRSMVNTWLKEVVQFANHKADDQLVHFFRWLKSSESMLYDPALFRMVRSIMKKLFLQLIAHLKELGAKITFASFNRILINTSKTNQHDAEKYMDFILSVIRKKELFNTLYLEPTTYYEHLVWMDPENLGGVLCVSLSQLNKREAQPTKSRRRKPRRPAEADDVEQFSSASEMDEGEIRPSQRTKRRKRRLDYGLDSDVETDSASDAESQIPSAQEPEQLPIEMHWNIATYLPEELCQDFFENIIGRWIYHVCLAKMDQRQERGGIGHTPLKAVGGGALGSSQQALQTKQGIKDEISKQLMSLVTTIDAQLPGDASADGLSEAFPFKAGSYLPFKIPALEFIKSVCHVLALDKAMSSDIARLKRDLLRIIQVPEFSSQARFKNPCLSYVLSDVICSYCNATRDLDLCRDEHLHTDSDGNTAWMCPDCEHVYDRESIEQQLIHSVEQHVMDYQLQDLKCTRCREVKGGNMNNMCECSAPYEPKTKPEVLLLHLNTMKNIASFHRLELLEEVASWAIAGIPQYVIDFYKPFGK